MRENAVDVTARDALVVGWGSELRGDDLAGVLVARTLAGRIGERARVLERCQLLPELALDVSRSRAVIFVDAYPAGPTDSIRVERIDATGGGMAADAQWRSAHGGDPAGICAMSRELYGRAPSECWVVGVPGTEFGLGSGMSARASEGVADAVAAVEWLLTNLKGANA